ncbi:histidine ammonia-lyase [Sphingobium sp. Sx8-8]|uniref:HAL/PAL/TAL family ammonia-lyase n=1 Tax=Sphingobium sp. Sx8-8 TaxID=2933617 RepID=UPI001F584FFB|nr:histidine ammonia-lyase [Sphingobium sp. Sx8-8]
MTDTCISIGPALDWRAVARVAEGGRIVLDGAAAHRIAAGRAVVESIVAAGIPAYGVNTGVGALVSQAVDPEQQRALSRNLVMSHACGVGHALPDEAVRAIIAAQVNNLAHGRSGVRLELVQALVGLITHNCVPIVPAGGSVGYLTHMAHIGLVVIGDGEARVGGRQICGAEALAAVGLAPLELETKEGLSLLNGAPCATGMACLALAQASRLVTAADTVASLSMEALGVQRAAFDAEVLALRNSPGIAVSGAAIRRWLADSRHLAKGGRLQDALSLRATPQVHGAVRDMLDQTGEVVDRELRSVTDNPAVSGTPQAPVVSSQAHAVAAGLAMALDATAIAVAHLGMVAERRLDRLVNPLVSGLPPFLSSDPGVTTGYMIAQYSGAALVAENRRLCTPASLDGGVTSALQEDYLAHPTAAALKLLTVISNVERIMGIELIAATEAHDLGVAPARRAPGTALIHAAVREKIGRYADDRPLAAIMDAGAELVRRGLPAQPAA